MTEMGVYRNIKRLLKARTNQADKHGEVVNPWTFVTESPSNFVWRRHEDCWVIYKNLNKHTGSVVYRRLLREMI